MADKLTRLKSILAEHRDISHAIALADWDKQANMPPGGAKERSWQSATLTALAHQRFTSPEVGQLLEDLQSSAASFDPDSDDARLLKSTARDYARRVKVPVEFEAEFAQVTSAAHTVWVKARAEEDFASFLPSLRRIFELRRTYAGFFAPYDHIYDPLLEDFEPGMKTAEVQKLFEWLRPRQVALIQAIANRPPIDDSFLFGHFDPQKQWDFGVEVLKRMGFDFNRGRQDFSAHPFTTSFGIGDVRITTHIDPHSLGSGFFSTVHEGGHALYNQGFSTGLAHTPLAEGASLAIHESQSRLWENLVARSRDFWVYYYPRLQIVFPSQLGSVSLDEFYRGINRVERSPVRVEADEATYNLHVMLRLELEIALIEGKLDPSDLPEAWNQAMRDYLGITPAALSKGVLQDVHWSGGTIGYFPTYALGNLISAQLWEKINQAIPDLPDQFRRGEFGALLEWLRGSIHRHGAKFEPQELVQRVTGSTITPEPYMRYLETKFGQIYSL